VTPNYVVVDPSSGDAIVIGDFLGELMPPAPASPINSTAGYSDFFVAKASGTTGAIVWLKAFGSTQNCHGAAVASDQNGNIYVTGSFQGTANFGGNNLVSAGAGDIFVMRLDAAGAHVWSERFGDAADESGSGIAVDALGTNVAVVGYYGGSPDFGGGALLPANGNNGFAAKLGAAGGGYLWAKGFGGSGSTLMADVRLTAAGSVVLVGAYDAAIGIGGKVLPSAGGQNAMVAELDGSTGNPVWSHGYADGANQQIVNAVSVDPSGSILFTGQMAGSVDFGGGALTSVGGNANVFVVKLDGTGNHTWSQRFAGASMGTGVGADGAGNVVLFGTFSGTLDIGAKSVLSAGMDDVFAAKLDPSGASPFWLQRFGSPGEEGAATTAVVTSGASAGASFIAGDFSGAISFGSTTLTNPGGFVARLAP
jgi:hypothetical protein